MPTPLLPKDRPAVEASLYDGQKIQAVNLYREFTDADLMSAKTAVEAIEAELRAASPDRFPKPAKSGCLSVLMLACMMVAAMAVVRTVRL